MIWIVDISVWAYIWADGVYLQARMEPVAECMLVIIGATPEGRKELLGFQVSIRESAQNWHELLVDLKARGLGIAPELAVGDGALGFWKALDEVFPGTRHQRCWFHKIGNVVNKFPKPMIPTVTSDLRDIHHAETRAAAQDSSDKGGAVTENRQADGFHPPPDRIKNMAATSGRKPVASRY